MELNVSHQRVVIISIKKDRIKEYMHPLIHIGLLTTSRCSFFSLTETCDDFTLIIDKKVFDDIPCFKEAEGFRKQEGPWVPLYVSMGAFSSCNNSGIAKIAKSLIIPLADAGITIYCLSTYQTDFILVLASQLENAMTCLSSHHNGLAHSWGTTMPLDRIQLLPESLRPIKHTVCYSNHTFHITSVDKDEGLQAVGLAIIEQLFYSNGPSEDRFFSLTRVGDDISIVLDSKTLERFPDNTLLGQDECWKMVQIGNLDDDLGFAECGIVAQISDPIADANISEYYISSSHADHVLVPDETYEEVVSLLEKHRLKGHAESASLGS